MSQPHMGEPFCSLDEWRDYWGRDLLSEMGIDAPQLTCAMCGSPTSNVSGFCTDTCETEHDAV